MQKTILTFGDSNTFGTPPMTEHGTVLRFDKDQRWPGVMQAETGCHLIEEGLPGRTAGALSDPIMGPHMNGHLGLRIALQSHGPIDRLVIMLGTNDLKAHFGLTPEGIAAGVAGLLAMAMGEEYQTRHGGFEVMMICPPPVLEQGIIQDQFWGAAAKAASLATLYQGLARCWGADFLDAGQYITVSPVDGVHFDPDSHVTLGKAIAAALG